MFLCPQLVLSAACNASPSWLTIEPVFITALLDVLVVIVPLCRNVLQSRYWGLFPVPPK
jgi:hypothetical protein